MNNLRERMAEHGFESNDDYEFQVRCLLHGKTAGIRTLSIEGDGERRKTAFAMALAHALGRTHVLYHDFTDTEATPEVLLPPSTDDFGRQAPPIDPLDDIVSQACALSEAEPTVLILDQLQSADFRDQIRLARLIRERRWLVRDAPYFANPHRLLLFLLSEVPLYHALRRESFQVWVGRVSERRVVFRPAEFGLDSTAVFLFGALDDLFKTLGATPTRSEVSHLLDDLIAEVRTEDHLRHALFGRCEGLDFCQLKAPALAGALSRIIDELRSYLGDEQIVISEPADPSDP